MPGERVNLAIETNNTSTIKVEPHLTKMIDRIALVLALFAVLTGQNVCGNVGADQPHATICLVRGANFVGSACSKSITFPNQRAFELSLASIVRYTVYSQGDIAITALMTCPPTASTPGGSRATQVVLNVEHGNVYYVDASAGRFERSDSLELAKQLGKIKNVMVHEESLEFPINRASIPKEDKGSGNGQCTCFLVSSSGYLVTNAHCISDAKTLRVRAVRQDTSTDHEVTVVATDPSNDLALLKIKTLAEPFPTPPFALRTTGIQQAERVFALGYPFAEAMGSELKVTEGIISAKSGVAGDLSKYQISAGLNPGNSGGPLIDEQGYLIGVLYAKSTLAESAGYAVKASYLSAFLDSVDGFERPAEVTPPSGTSVPERIAVLKDFVWILNAE